jgi:hypothetical protein
VVVLYSKSGSVVTKVVVIPEKQSQIVLVNNALRDRGVLKFVLVIWAIKEY